MSFHGHLFTEKQHTSSVTDITVCLMNGIIVQLIHNTPYQYHITNLNEHVGPSFCKLAHRRYNSPSNMVTMDFNYTVPVFHLWFQILYNEWK
jgi:hypothetical protein